MIFVSNGTISIKNGAVVLGDCCCVPTPTGCTKCETCTGTATLVVTAIDPEFATWNPWLVGMELFYTNAGPCIFESNLMGDGDNSSFRCEGTEWALAFDDFSWDVLIQSDANGCPRSGHYRWQNEDNSFMWFEFDFVYTQ